MSKKFFEGVVKNKNLLNSNRNMRFLASSQLLIEDSYLFPCFPVAKTLLQRRPCQEPVVHSCNPSYPGSRDQEDQGSKPAQANGF
jgi:hypothetical protein